MTSRPAPRYPSTSLTTTRRAFLGATAAGAVGVAGAALLAGPASAATVSRRPVRADIALTHVTLIDATGARPRPDMTVLLAAGRIVAVGQCAEVPVPHGAEVRDLAGRFLIPGLCDMHVHSSAEEIDLPLQIANGVTTVREMWGHPYLHQWRTRIEAGTLFGPRYVIGSPIIDGSPTLWNGSGPRPSAPIVVRTEAEARRAVRRVTRDGADFVKIYSRLSREAFHGIADEARRQGIRFGGHCPDAVPVAEAVRAGLWSFEHLDGIWWSTSVRESELRRRIARIRIDPADAYGSWFAQIGVLEWEGATTYCHDKAERLFSHLRRHRSWQVPTLTMLQRLDVPGDPDDLRMKYVPADEAAFWAQWADARTKERTPEQAAQHRELFRRRLRLVGAMRQADVPVLAGTDLGTTYLFPGFSLHDELALLVDAGLTPMQALQAATSAPATFLGLQRSQGTISVGKAADLVVLNADPLADIGNTRRIEAVVVRGRWISSAAREALLAGAARAANPPGSGTAAARLPRRCGCLRHVAA